MMKKIILIQKNKQNTMIKKTRVGRILREIKITTKKTLKCFLFFFIIQKWGHLIR